MAVSSLCLNKENRPLEEREEGKQRSLEHKHLPPSPCFPLAPGVGAVAQTHTTATGITALGVELNQRAARIHNWASCHIGPTVFSGTFRHTRGGLHSFTTSPHKKSGELALYLHLITLTLCVTEQATLCPVRCLTDTSPVRKCRDERWLIVFYENVLNGARAGKKKGGQHLSGGVYFFLNVLHGRFRLRTGRLTRFQQRIGGGKKSKSGAIFIEELSRLLMLRWKR